MDLFPMNELKKLVDEHLSVVRETIGEDPDSQFVPIIDLVIGREHHHEMVAFADFGDERFDAMFSLGEEYGRERKQVVAIVFVNEAWMSQRSLDDTSPFVQPSKDPNRKEVVFIIGMTIELKYHSLYIPILRDEQGRRSLGKPIGGDDAHSSSNLLEEFWRGFTLAYHYLRHPERN